MNRIKLANGALVLAIILAFIGIGILFSTAASAPTTDEPVPTATKKPPISTGKNPEFEIAAGVEPAADTVFGSVNVSYPVRFTPGSSDVLRVLIQLPPELASLSVGDFDRIPIPPDAPPIAGTVSSYQTTIPISTPMRVELTSPTFDVSPVNLATQPIDMTPGGQPALWAWTLVAPEAGGLHVLVVQAFLGEETSPVWARSFQVEVINPNPPFLESSGGKVLVGAVTTILAALIGLFGTLVGKGIIFKQKEGQVEE